MLESVVAASCMPCHDDWLNDLSSMPPVSVTMQPTNLLAAAAPGLLDPLPPDPLLAAGELPQAAASSAIALNATTALDVPLTKPPLRGRPAAARKDRRPAAQYPAGWGKSSRMIPPGLPEG